MSRLRHGTIVASSSVALTLGLLVAVAGGMVGTAAAGAARPAPHSSPYFTGGWQDEFGPAGNVVSKLTFTSVGLVAGLGPAVIVFQGKAGAISDINKFTAPYKVHFAAGTTYSSDQGASIDTPCVGSFSVDYLVLSGTTSTVAAVRYTMTCPNGDTIVGAMAANLLNQAGAGYYLFNRTGALYGFGSNAFGNNAFLCYLGSLGAVPLNAPVVAMAPTPDGAGYDMLGADGGVFSFGDAAFHGSTGNLHLVAPVVGIAMTLDGGGYWLVAADGGVFAFGDAGYYGSMGGKHLNQPIVGIAPTRYGHGYWLVAADGGVFAFGDAGFFGSSGAHPPSAPAVGLAPAPNGIGYWLVTAGGAVSAYGDALGYGSASNLTLAHPIVAMTATPDGGGYWLVDGGGGVFSYGDATYGGGLAGTAAGAGTAGIVHT